MGIVNPSSFPLADGFAPGLLAGAIMIIVIILMIAVAIVAVAVILFACIFLLAIMGIISASVITALARRSISSGFRVFFLCSGTLAGVPFGIAGLYLILDLPHSLFKRALWGAFPGALIGFFAAMAFNQAWTFGIAELMRRLNGRSRPGFPVIVQTKSV